MRRITVLLLILTLGISLIGCSKNDEVEAEFTGTIIEINGYFAIVSADEEQDIRSSGDLVEVNLSVNEETMFNVGDRVKVGYDGAIQEKYPLGINALYVELFESE